MDHYEPSLQVSAKSIQTSCKSSMCDILICRMEDDTEQIGEYMRQLLARYDSIRSVHSVQHYQSLARERDPLPRQHEHAKLNKLSRVQLCILPIIFWKNLTIYT